MTFLDQLINNESHDGRFADAPKSRKKEDLTVRDPGQDPIDVSIPGPNAAEEIGGFPPGVVLE